MSLVTVHNRRHQRQDPDATSTVGTRSEFSLDGLPVGSADDLMSFAEQVGGLKRVE